MVLLILAIWVAVSALLVVAWGVYRHFVGPYDLEDFEVRREPALQPAASR